MAVSPEATASPVFPADPLAVHVGALSQREAARLVQDAFSTAFRLTVGDLDPQTSAQRLNALQQGLESWVAQGEDDEARAARMGLLMAGLDQWGVAWCSAFALVAIPGLSELMRRLRTGLAPEAEARFLLQFESIAAGEHNAADFKIALHRALHLTLWHCMIAAEERDEALRLAACLGSLLYSLTSSMPLSGWRLVADAVAHIQFRCLADGLAADGIAQESTQALFAALTHALPAAERDAIMAHAGQAVLAWRQAQRPH